MRTCGCEGEGGICNDCLMKTVVKAADAIMPVEAERVIECARKLVAAKDQDEARAALKETQLSLAEFDKLLEDNRGQEIIDT